MEKTWSLAALSVHLETAYLAKTKKKIAESTVNKSKNRLNSAVGPMNNSKNKLKVEIS